jgi:osmotically-inducible protein OsmY
MIPAAIVAAAGMACNADPDPIADSRIVGAIEDEYQTAANVPANNIDINVREGIVSLSGSAPTILERDRAVRIASMVKGVRGIVNRIEVSAKDRPASEVRGDVLTALAADPATDSWQIGVSVDGGTVTLTGSVDSYAERELCKTVAKTVEGVRKIENEIEIAYDADRPDNEIQYDVTQRLRWDARIDDGLIEVEVDEGEVTLNGSVGSLYERTLCISDAWVSGVTSVNAEDLEVEWWARDDMQRTAEVASITDSEIREAIKDTMRYDPRVYSFNPDVSVNDGIVTLTGTVDDLKAKRAASQDAKNTMGVSHVKNYLKVRPEGQFTDHAIENDVEAALTMDPTINRREVTVMVDDGTAELYGEVNSYFERAHAEDVAARTLGVRDVDNHLSVGYDMISYDRYYDWDPVLHDFDHDAQRVTMASDAEIQSEIESELFWSPFVDSDDIGVKVVDGTATLSGHVDSWNEHDAAVENAFEGGAIGIVNDIEVRLD